MSERSDDALSRLLAALLGFQGAIGKGKYFLGLAIALGLSSCSLSAVFATAMNPTGGGAPLLGFRDAF